MEDVTIVKLGGSVITHKETSPPAVRSESLSRIAGELKYFGGRLVVVLGGGAHGHQAAHKYGFGNRSTTNNRRIAGVPEIRRNMTELSLAVLDALHKEDIPAALVSPFDSVILKDKHIHHYPLEIPTKILSSNLVLLTHGDVCLDTVLGASILSGDTIVSHLAQELSAKSVLLGTNVDGIYTSNPIKNPEAELVPIIDSKNVSEVLSGSGPSSSTDVTGGMLHKLKELLVIAEHCPRVIVFNLGVSGRLTSLLSGNETRCTLITI